MIRPAPIIILLALCPPAVALGAPDDDAASAPLLAPRTLAIDLAAGIAAEAARQPADPPSDGSAPLDRADLSLCRGYGHPGACDWLSINAGYANDFEEEQDLNVSLGWSRFFARELEFNVEAGAWYFDQIGENTGGLSAIMHLRWHFLGADSDFEWSLYGEAGIGLLAGFDEVPDRGTGLGFTPRIGLGYTRRIFDDGTRLQVGVRWHHISNGRIEGDGRNPGRDSLMLYAGLIFPF